jgi:hypothetical protein
MRDTAEVARVGERRCGSTVQHPRLDSQSAGHAGLCWGLCNVRRSLGHWSHREHGGGSLPIFRRLPADAFSEIDENAGLLADGPSVVAWLDDHSIALADLGCVAVFHLDVQPA